MGWRRQGSYDGANPDETPATAQEHRMASLHSLQAVEVVQAARRAPASRLFHDSEHYAGGSPLRSYWSPRWLHGFSLLMAGHGRCVNESLMLCDPAYARSRLREACAMDDQALQQMAVEMLASMGPESHAGVPPPSH